MYFVLLKDYKINTVWNMNSMLHTIEKQSQHLFVHEIHNNSFDSYPFDTQNKILIEV